MKYLLGIDIGTQSIRTHLYDENAALAAGVSAEQYVDIEKASWASQKADFWWQSVRGNIHRLLQKTGIDPKDIVSVGCCAHMHGPVPVGQDGHPLMNDIQLYCDKRTTEIVQELRAKEPEKYLHISGNFPATAWFGLKIRWIKEHYPQVYENARKFLTPKDFINFKLTGEACIDPTEASGSYAMDWKTQQWSDDLLGHIGIDREKMPRIEGTFSVIGQVSGAAARETGLHPGTKVICGCGDMLASLYVSGLNNPDVCVDLTATASLLCCYSHAPVMDPRVMNLKSVTEGWIPYGALDAAGAGFRWIRDTVAKAESARARERGIDEYDALSALADKVPAGAQGLVYLPYLLGERTMGSADSRGCFIGLHLGSDIGQMVRALLEGVAFEHKRILDLFAKNGCKPGIVYHTSGGAKGSLWNQIKADIYQMPVRTLKADEGSVLGIALLGGVGAGLYDSPWQALNLVFAVDQEYLPRSENAQIYQDTYGVYCELHDMLQKPFSTLATINRN